MANTYCSLTIHCVFSTKNREPFINEPMQSRLWAFVGGIAKQNQFKALCIGGVSDHVHALLSIPAALSVAKAVQLIKGGSSKWVHENFPEMADFAWQEGYGAFAVGISQIPETLDYIQKQADHHKVTTFQKEYLNFLKKHNVSYDERYLWD